MSRNMRYLNSNNRIIYRRGPINDQPSETFEWGMHSMNQVHMSVTNCLGVRLR